MAGEKNLQALLKTMQPELNEGVYVFCVIDDLRTIEPDYLVCFLREREGFSVILKQEEADRLQLSYTFVAAWITLTIHSSLEAIGLTAAFSQALSEHGISCNVVAGYYHDHIFVPLSYAQKAMSVLHSLSAEG